MDPVLKDMLAEMGVSLVLALYLVWAVFILPTSLGRSLGNLRSENFQKLSRTAKAWGTLKTTALLCLMLLIHVKVATRIALTEPFDGWSVVFGLAIWLIAFVQLRDGYREKTKTL